MSDTQEQAKTLKVALAGNPNTGKTTIFNALTGSHQHIANYPGVTVSKIEGTLEHNGVQIDLVDLPGSYSLTAYSIDELVARNFIIHEKPDLIVNVVDSSNLERNLYLSVQFMEMDIPLLLVFNRSDIAKARGYTIDTEILASLLSTTIVKTVAHKGEGLDELKDAILHVGLATAGHRPAKIHYAREIEDEIGRIVPMIDAVPALAKAFDPRWLTVKLLENDSDIKERAEELSGNDDVVSAALDAALRIKQHFGDSAEVVIADNRYGFISGACQEAVQNSIEVRHDMSDRIDAIVTNRLFGIPIFLGLMYSVFKLTFTVGEIPMQWIEKGVALLGHAVTAIWPQAWGETVLSILVDGVIAGVGSVLVFLPMIMILFLAIAVLEDSGYMARAAFIVDRAMHKIGLHGRSFIPMLIGFGCTVPAILATRTLESRRDRLTTMMVLPLFSCGARLPIYTLFIPAFFPPHLRTPVLMSLYVIGVIMAALLARLLRATILKGDTTPLVMELPPYRIPTVRGLCIDTWQRSWMFVRKAGTIILAISVLLWFLTSYPKLDNSQLENLSEGEVAAAQLSHSVAGRIGHAIEPVMRVAGFDWKASTAMIGAFAAKEVFVAQMGIVHSLGDVSEDTESLRSILQREYTPLQAFCIMLFCLISTPCVATIAATVKESGSWKWGALQLTGLTVLAYCTSAAVFQVGKLLFY